MDAEMITRLRPMLSSLLKEFRDCFVRREQPAHLRRLVAGQVSDLQRKSLEPIALASGTRPRTLQEFLSGHGWDDALMRDRLERIVVRDHPHPCSIGIFDETPHVKKGDKTPGVQRQWCSTRGTTDNCTLTVHLGYAAGDFHCLLDGDLYLPKKTWGQDRDRCRAAGIPDHVVYRPKTRIALDMHAHALANGVRFEWMTFDEAYGQDPAFLHELSDRGQRYVAEVPPSFTGWTKRPPVMLREHPCHSHKTPGGAPIGRPRNFPRVKVLPGDMHKAKSVENLARHSPAFTRQAWQTFHVKDTTKGPVVWKVKSAPFYLKREGVPTWEHWLVVCRNPLTEEIKYFVSNAPPGTPLEAIMHVGFQRWHVERCFQDEKSELGLSHFEVRNYRSLIRHLRITAVSHLFLAQTHQRLRAERGERDAPDRLPGPDCGQRPDPSPAPARSGASGVPRENSGAHQLPPASQRRGSTSPHPHLNRSIEKARTGRPSHALLHAAMKKDAL